MKSKGWKSPKLFFTPLVHVQITSVRENAFCLRSSIPRHLFVKDDCTKSTLFLILAEQKEVDGNVFNLCDTFRDEY